MFAFLARVFLVDGRLLPATRFLNVLRFLDDVGLAPLHVGLLFLVFVFEKRRRDELLEWIRTRTTDLVEPPLARAAARSLVGTFVVHVSRSKLEESVEAGC